MSYSNLKYTIALNDTLRHNYLHDFQNEESLSLQDFLQKLQSIDHSDFQWIFEERLEYWSSCQQILGQLVSTEQHLKIKSNSRFKAWVRGADDFSTMYAEQQPETLEEYHQLVSFIEPLTECDLTYFKDPHFIKTSGDYKDHELDIDFEIEITDRNLGQLIEAFGLDYMKEQLGKIAKSSELLWYTPEPDEDDG